MQRRTFLTTVLGSLSLPLIGAASPATRIGHTSTLIPASTHWAPLLARDTYRVGATLWQQLPIVSDLTPGQTPHNPAAPGHITPASPTFGSPYLPNQTGYTVTQRNDNRTPLQTHVGGTETRPDRPANPAAAQVLLQESSVAGFQYHDGERVWERLRIGSKLHLVHETDNRYDRRAVAIYFGDAQLGYLARQANYTVAQMLDRGQVVSAQISELNESDDPWRRVRVRIFV